MLFKLAKVHEKLWEVLFWDTMPWVYDLDLELDIAFLRLFVVPQSVLHYLCQIFSNYILLRCSHSFFCMPSRNILSAYNFLIRDQPSTALMLKIVFGGVPFSNYCIWPGGQNLLVEQGLRGFLFFVSCDLEVKNFDFYPHWAIGWCELKGIGEKVQQYLQIAIIITWYIHKIACIVLI